MIQLNLEHEEAHVLLQAVMEYLSSHEEKALAEKAVRDDSLATPSQLYTDMTYEQRLELIEICDHLVEQIETAFEED